MWVSDYPVYHVLERCAYRSEHIYTVTPDLWSSWAESATGHVLKGILKLAMWCFFLWVRIKWFFFKKMQEKELFSSQQKHTTQTARQDRTLLKDSFPWERKKLLIGSLSGRWKEKQRGQSRTHLSIHFFRAANRHIKNYCCRNDRCLLWKIRNRIVLKIGKVHS